MSLRTAVFVIGVLAAGLPLAPGAGRAQPAEAEPWVLPRTADGQPDLQGIWSNNSATPLERPEALGDQAELTEEELARARERYAQIFGSGDGDAAFGDRVFTTAIGDESAFEYGNGSAGNYNQFWMVDRDFDNRTSLVVDPPTGRLPPFTPEAQRRADARREHFAANPGSSYTDRRLQERCITVGMPNLFPGYNSNFHILQTPDHVVFLHEMMHDARIIPLGDAPHVDDDIRQWHGDPRGYWDGDTLVVETTNFSAKAESPAAVFTRHRGSAGQLRLVERFTRVDRDTIEHRFTVDDPGTYSAPWTAVIRLKRTGDVLYEYACHEGNVGMVGILAGHRAEERRAAEAAAGR